MKNKLKKDLNFIKGWIARTIIALILWFVISYLLDLNFNYDLSIMIAIYIGSWIALYLLEAWLYSD